MKMQQRNKIKKKRYKGKKWKKTIKNSGITKDCTEGQ
jgi:hypothetical protein